MRCEKARDLLMTDYLDGEAVEKVCREIETHLAQCAQCRQFAGELKQAASAPFKQAGQINPPDRVWMKIKAQIQNEQKTVVPAARWDLGDLVRLVLSPRSLPVLVPVVALLLFFAIAPFLRKPDPGTRALSAYLFTNVGSFTAQDLSQPEFEGNGLDAVIEEFFI